MADKIDPFWEKKKVFQKPYQCKDRMENINFEQMLESKRKLHERKIEDYEADKHMFKKDVEVLQREIDNLKIEIEVLDNYEKYFLDDGFTKRIEEYRKKKKVIDKQDSIDKANEDYLAEIRQQMRVILYYSA